jgi:LPS O-antigen subunit length determinant protein (WzzB/FepE family)
MTAPDITPENVARMLERLRFHDMRVNLGDAADMLEALAARLAEVEAESDTWEARAAAYREQKITEIRRANAAEAKVARLKEALARRI